MKSGWQFLPGRSRLTEECVLEKSMVSIPGAHRRIPIRGETLDRIPNAWHIFGDVLFALPHESLPFKCITL
jgi:hypothetical protein